MDNVAEGPRWAPALARNPWQHRIPTTMTRLGTILLFFKNSARILRAFSTFRWELVEVLVFERTTRWSCPEAGTELGYANKCIADCNPV